MSEVLTLTGPIAYKNGVEVSTKFVGYSGGPCVLRYQFVAPLDGYATDLQLSTTIRYYSGPGGTASPIRVKVTDSATSHIAAGADTEDFDAEYSYYVSSANTEATIPISGLQLTPGRTYYLYLFPGTSEHYLCFLYDNNAKDLSTLAYTAMLSGLVAIGNGNGWDAYACWIDNGENWERYIPYIDDGTSWIMCSADASDSGGDPDGDESGDLTATVSGETLILSGDTVSVSGETLVLNDGSVSGETLTI